MLLLLLWDGYGWSVLCAFQYTKPYRHGHITFQRQYIQTLVGSLAAAATVQMCRPLTHLTCSPIDCCQIFHFPSANCLGFKFEIDFISRETKTAIFHLPRLFWILYFSLSFVARASECFLRQYLIVFSLRNRHY